MQGLQCGDQSCVTCHSAPCYHGTGQLHLTWSDLFQVNRCAAKASLAANVNIDHPAVCVCAVPLVYNGYIEIGFNHWGICRYEWDKYVTWTFAAALKSPDIKELLIEITYPNRDEFADMISGELHKQLKPFKDALTAKDAEIKELKDTIDKLETKVEELEQHSHRDSLHIAGIPENAEHDDTDTAILNICQAISVDPPVQPSDIAVSPSKTRQVIFATKNVRERVYSAQKNIKTAKITDPSLNKIYINEDLTKFRANLAKKARATKQSGKISDTWTQYGKILIKDLHNHVKVINSFSEL